MLVLEARLCIGLVDAYQSTNKAESPFQRATTEIDSVSLPLPRSLLDFIDDNKKIYRLAMHDSIESLFATSPFVPVVECLYLLFPRRKLVLLRQILSAYSLETQTATCVKLPVS